MVPLNSNHRDTTLFQLIEPIDSMNQCESIDSTLIEEIARNHHKIDGTLDRIICNIPKSATEIVKALAHPILLITQVGIRNMNERSSHKFFSNQNQGRCYGPVINARTPAASITRAAILKINRS